MPRYEEGEYIIYEGEYREPLGLLYYGGKYYYSDEPPWVTPTSIALSKYRKRTHLKFKLIPVNQVSNEIYEIAKENENNKKYYKTRV